MSMTHEMKRHYEKPAMKTYPLPGQTALLSGSLPIDDSTTNEQW